MSGCGSPSGRCRGCGLGRPVGRGGLSVWRWCQQGADQLVSWRIPPHEVSRASSSGRSRSQLGGCCPWEGFGDGAVQGMASVFGRLGARSASSVRNRELGPPWRGVGSLRTTTPGNVGHVVDADVWTLPWPSTMRSKSRVSRCCRVDSQGCAVGVCVGGREVGPDEGVAPLAGLAAHLVVEDDMVAGMSRRRDDLQMPRWGGRCRPRVSCGGPGDGPAVFRRPAPG